MSNPSSIAPQNVRQYFARSKSLLKRNETLRALDALISGLDLYDPSKLLVKARFETEVLIQESVIDIGRQPNVRNFFEQIARSSKMTVSYTPGEEAKLRATLEILRKGLQNMEEEKAAVEHEKHDHRRQSLQEKGLNYLKAGDAARGKSALRIVADEFGDEPGVLTQVGLWLQEANLQFDALEFLEQAIEQFPKEYKAYGAATAIYTDLREFDKAEAVYLKALKAFGKHPRTLLNLAKIYVSWNKKGQAFEAAQEAYKLDPTLAEAKEIVDKFA